MPLFPNLTLPMNSDLISCIYFDLSFLDIEPIKYRKRFILAIASIKVAWGVNCIFFLPFPDFAYIALSLKYVTDL